MSPATDDPQRPGGSVPVYRLYTRYSAAARISHTGHPLRRRTPHQSRKGHQDHGGRLLIPNANKRERHFPPDQETDYLDPGTPNDCQVSIQPLLTAVWYLCTTSPEAVSTKVSMR